MGKGDASGAEEVTVGDGSDGAALVGVFIRKCREVGPITSVIRKCSRRWGRRRWFDEGGRGRFVVDQGAGGVVER